MFGGFQRIYEELKHIPLVATNDVHYRFQRTYEELKHPNTTRRSCFSV